jgi:hypothetical protein
MLESSIKPSIIGSSVVSVVFQLPGVIAIDTPNTCKVLIKVDEPGWLVVIVIGSKKSKSRAAIMPAL